MTFSPKVWGDALRLLQNETPDFAFDAWIAPLQAKIAPNHLVLGCPNSFHRDRVRLHHLEAIERAVAAAAQRTVEHGDTDTHTDKSTDTSTDSDGPAIERGIEAGVAEARAQAPRIELVTAAEFAEFAGTQIEVKVGMRRVTSARLSHAVNGPSVVAPRSQPSTGERSGGDLRPAPVDGPRPTLRAVPGAMDVAVCRDSASREPETTAFESARLAPGSNEAGTPAARLHKPRPDVRNDAAAGGEGFSPNGGFGGGPRTDPHPPFGLDGQPGPRRGQAGEPHFSFENFIIGPCNALAREATLALARRRQQSLNLLYLAALGGMGKTHLARAAADEARHQLASRGARRAAASPGRGSSRNAERPRVIYTTAEQFTSEFVSAMRNGRNEAWAARYRGAIELLVVEDIQLLRGRSKTQQELFHTIDHVLDAGGRVLLTGDRAPRDLTGLDDRLRAQVARGFVAEIDPPDSLVRRHILRAKAAAGGVHLPADCLDRLVDATESTGLGASVTELESLLIQVVTTASLLGRPIEAALVQDAIDLKTGAGAELAPRQIAVPEIVKAVAAFFGTRPESLASRSRRRDVLVPRQLAMYLADRYTDASYTEIGRALGRDHPSVANAIKKIERQILENAPIRYQVEALSEKIEALLSQTGA